MGTNKCGDLRAKQQHLARIPNGIMTWRRHDCFRPSTGRATHVPPRCDERQDEMIQERITTGMALRYNVSDTNLPTQPPVDLILSLP